MENTTINLESEIFKQNIYSLINKSSLPISNVYFIFSLIENQLEKQYYATLNEESFYSQKEQNEEKNIDIENDEKE